MPKPAVTMPTDLVEMVDLVVCLRPPIDAARDLFEQAR